MTPEVTKTVLNKIILNVWIENGPILNRRCPKSQQVQSVECRTYPTHPTHPHTPHTPHIDCSFVVKHIYFGNYTKILKLLIPDFGRKKYSKVELSGLDFRHCTNIVTRFPSLDLPCLHYYTFSLEKDHFSLSVI
jgi:hypothetical protein